MKNLTHKKILFILFSLLILGPAQADQLRVLARKLKEACPTKKYPLLGILDFTYPKGQFSTGSFLIPERLVTYLVQEGMPVIERRLLQKVLEEKRLCDSGLMKSSSSDKMGKIAGVDAVLVGSLRDLSEESTEVVARIIQVDSTKILAVASVVIPRLWGDDPRFMNMTQMRALVPIFYSEFPEVFEKESGDRETYKLQELYPSKKKQRYHSAPVPFIPTSSSMEIRGQI